MQNIDIYKNNFIIGKMRVMNFERNDNLNFFSYIYSDYSLKTVLALDLSTKNKYKDLKEN